MKIAQILLFVIMCADALRAVYRWGKHGTDEDTIAKSLAWVLQIVILYYAGAFSTLLP